MTYRSLKIALVFVVLFMGVVARANAEDSKTALSQQFVELLRYKDQFKKYQEECLSTQRMVSPKALISRNENYFGGIRPGHPKWQGIVAAYESYFVDVCSRPTEKTFLTALAKSYAETMSVQQLKQAIKFYSSPTGKVLVDANTHAVSTLYEIWTKVNGEHILEANARLQKTISDLVR